jgi:16S rRNA (adenine1518-N6/adenine1519-N6)-dimethyltransferase
MALFNNQVKAKKFLGQHFLKDLSIAKAISDAVSDEPNGRKVIEVGPGMGVLTQYLIEKPIKLQVVEIDRESVAYLKANYPALENNIIEGDFLQLPLGDMLDESSAVVGNFPYNISSQILFHCLDHKESVQEIVGMFQKEVGERIAAPHGKKDYGIISVLLQTYYDTEYLFTVDANVFNPPPKVQSSVVRLRRKEVVELPVPYAFFRTVVKTAFNQRRKTLRNALKSMMNGKVADHRFFDLRAEQLSVSDFKELALLLSQS